MAEVTIRLEDQLGPSEDVGMASITASELLHGVHRATAEHRARREAFVEAVLAAFPPFAFDLLYRELTQGSGPSSPRPASTWERTTVWWLPPRWLLGGV